MYIIAPKIIHTYEQLLHKTLLILKFHNSTYNASGRVNYCQEFIAIKDLGTIFFYPICNSVRISALVRDAVIVQVTVK